MRSFAVFGASSPGVNFTAISFSVLAAIVSVRATSNAGLSDVIVNSHSVAKTFLNVTAPAPPRSPPPCCAAPRPRPHPLPAHARCGGWAPRSPHSSRCSAPCPPVRGSTPSSPHGAERPASASPLVSQPPSPPACAPQAPLPAQQRSPPPNPSTRCKHAPPRLSMPASQPRPTVCRLLRVPHRRPETAGVALQGASPGRGIRRRPSTGMYGGPEQT